MKRTIRIIAMLLALCILAGASSVTAFADVATDEERAEAFIDAVNEIYEKTSILDRETAIAVAKSEAMYFDDESFDDEEFDEEFDEDFDDDDADKN